MFILFYYFLFIQNTYFSLHPQEKVKSYRENAYSSERLRFGENLTLSEGVYFCILCKGLWQPQDPSGAAVKVGETADSVVTKQK